MLLTSEARTHVTTFTQKPETFSIAATAHAFKILSSNLYEDPVRACVREIIANGLDAMTRAGKADQPIKVFLPTTLNPEFRVRDYGPSMSHDFVLSLYTTYFASDKNQDNAEIGGFGLGSKTPYAVSDQFTVRCVQNGQRRIYQCFLNTDGLPQIQPLELYANTDEPDGTEIVVPIPNRKINTVIEAYHQVVEYLPVQPENNYEYAPEPAKPFFTLPWNNWTLEVHSSKKPSAFVLGVFPYRIPYNTNLNELYRRNGSAGLVVHAPIGALTVTPSRESLSLTEFDVDRLNALAEHTIKAFAAVVQKKISTLTTVREVTLYLKKARDLMPLNGTHLHWRGYSLASDCLYNNHHYTNVPNVPTNHIGKPSVKIRARNRRTTLLESLDSQPSELNFHKPIKVLNLPAKTSRWAHLTENDEIGTQYVVFSSPNEASVRRWAAFFGAEYTPYERPAAAARISSGAKARPRESFLYTGMTLDGSHLKLTLDQALERAEKHPILDAVQPYHGYCFKDPEAFSLTIPGSHTRAMTLLAPTADADDLIDWDATAHRMARYHLEIPRGVMPSDYIMRHYMNEKPYFTDCPDFIRIMELAEALRKLGNVPYISMRHGNKLLYLIELQKQKLEAQSKALETELAILKAKYPALWEFDVSSYVRIPREVIRAYILSIQGTPQ